MNEKSMFLAPEVVPKASGCSGLLPGCSWLILVALGCSWLLLAAPGCLWLLWAALGCFRLLRAAACSSLEALGGSWGFWKLLKGIRKLLEGFWKLLEGCPKLLEASGGFWQHWKASGSSGRLLSFWKASGSFSKASGGFWKASGSFWKVYGSVWKLLEAFGSSGSSLRLLEALEGFWKLLECFLECSKVALLDCSLGWLSRVALLEWSCEMLSWIALLDCFLGLLWLCFFLLFGVSCWGNSGLR